MAGSITENWKIGILIKPGKDGTLKKKISLMLYSPSLLPDCDT